MTCVAAVPFKTKFSYEERVVESGRVRRKYPSRVPVVVERAESAQTMSHIDRQRFLVPYDLTVGQLAYIIRRRVKLEPDNAMFLFFGGQSAAQNEFVSAVDERCREEDGFLYATYTCENTFGHNSGHASRSARSF
jgi:GABA(A) receptor-associated protein